MQALNNQNKSQYEQELTHIFGRVKLQCDGYEVTLVVEMSKMKLLVMTYINGQYKGAWAMPKDGVVYPEQMFLNKKIIRAYSPKKKADLIKKLGKKLAHELFGLDKETFYYTPVWASGKTAINHLLKVCKSVEIIE